MLCTWFCARRLADSGIMNSLALPSLQGRQAGRQAGGTGAGMGQLSQAPEAPRAPAVHCIVLHLHCVLLS